MKNRHQRRTEQAAKPAAPKPEQLVAAINAQWDTMREVVRRICDLGDALHAQFQIPFPPPAAPPPPEPKP